MSLKVSSLKASFEGRVKRRRHCAPEGGGERRASSGGGGKGNRAQDKPCVRVWPCARLCVSPSHGGSCWTPFLNSLPEPLIYAAFGAMELDSPPSYSKIIAAGYSWEFSNSFKLETRNERWRKVLLRSEEENGAQRCHLNASNGAWKHRTMNCRKWTLAQSAHPFVFHDWLFLFVSSSWRVRMSHWPDS